ncbi:MAG: hypothetical protein IJ302_00970 [Clostridia bacterium]|nr:hypothetical protein [Clostridia bacterium]
MAGLTVSVSVDLDTERLERIFASRCDAAAAVLADTIRRDCEPYVPYDTGALCRSARIAAAAEGEGQYVRQIRWEMPYAAAVYYGDSRGVSFHTEHHPHACAKWFEAARAACAAGWTEAADACLRQR